MACTCTERGVTAGGASYDVKMAKDLRVTVFKSLENYNARHHGKAVLLRSTIEETLSLISSKFCCPIKELQTIEGGLIDDVALIRDGDVLLALERKLDLVSPSPRPSVSPVPFEVNDLPEDQLHDTSPAQPIPPTTSLLRTTNDPAIFAFKKCSAILSTDSPSRHDWVRLNVGGRIFATTRRTLTADPLSMLARMFESEWFSTTDDTGAYLIDRSPEYFEPLLNFLRHGKLIINEGTNPQGVLEEAKFFHISKVFEPLEALIHNDDLSYSGHMTRKEFVQLIINTSSSASLRCQGINLESVDLSNLDLRHINFKCANLHRCNLSGSDLSHCILERADLSHATLEGAILRCVYMPRVNLEGACLKGCSMEENLGGVTNLEGANLKGALFDNSQMNGVNLRLASLKGACLRSCNLRYSVMAGTDLEDSDLQGCDLRNANLRGANLAGVNFDDILAPLHMSQTVNVNVSSSQNQLSVEQ